MKCKITMILLPTIAASIVMQSVMAMVWMNPLTTRIILTPEFGQSQKLINVWTLWEPLPRLAQMPSWPMIVGFSLFSLLHVLVYKRFSALFPGNTWFGKGLSLAAGIFIFQYTYFEFFTPFNQYHEPLYLIAYELLLQGIMAFAEGLTISWLMEKSPMITRQIKTA
ncbi:MAG: hypothetical protein HY272_08890 [Gammaproteobacteria bacterium]|nr:hypothetical protein [Gammaproteobacteria bacterium]